MEGENTFTYELCVSGVEDKDEALMMAAMFQTMELLDRQGYTYGVLPNGDLFDVVKFKP